MTDLFISLFNMSITASWLVLAVIVLRVFLKKAPKWINTVLWIFVGIRLVCPFSFESIFSLVPSTDTIPQNITSGPSFDVHTGINIVDNQVNDYLGSHYFEGVTVPVNTGFTVVNIFTVLWIFGIVAMLIYSGVSFIRLNAKVREGVVLKDNIWLCDRIDTPFILGLVRPRIFLPSGMSESDMEYVIAHEKAHLKRNDHWWKPLGFLLLTVYWFNPVMWIAYILLCRDIELACDEKVIKEMGTDIRKSYSEALINCSVSRRTISACPLAFGETGVKGRIKSVLSYKKPTLWIIIIAVISCIVVGVCFLTNPKTDLKKTNPELDKAVSQAILDINSSRDLYNTECLAEGHTIYGIEEEGDNVTVYLLEEFAGFGFKNGYFMEQTGHRTPAVYAFAKIDDAYILTDYEYALPGESYADSIREMFPKEYHSRILDYNEKDNANLWPQCVAYAEAYLKKIGREAEVCHYSEVPHTMLTDVGVSVEVSNKLVENNSLNHYDSDIGNYETLEDGVRFVYRTDFDKARGVIIFTTEVYKTGDIIEKIEVDGQTGKIVFNESYDVILPEPENSPETTVEWVFSPAMSAIRNSHLAVEFGFDSDYTHTVTSCSNGEMFNIDADDQPHGSTLQFKKGETIYWFPDEEVFNQEDYNAEVHFTVYNGDEQIYYGSLLLTCIERGGFYTFEICLQDSDGLSIAGYNNGVCIIEDYNGSDITSYDHLDKLDYTTAGKIVSETWKKYSITAVHCPASGEVESGILVGEAYGNEVAAFLNSVNWKKSLPPIESLSSPGSVEFVIDDDYRVTVYERKKGSLFAYAVVKYGDEERYYHASYDDYNDAVAILHPPAEMSASSIAYPVNSYSYLTEYDSAYISLTPVTKQAHFSLSRLSSYFCIGRYTENDNEIIITAEDMKHQYTFRKDGNNLIFIADKSTEMPEYKYETDMEPVPCIPDGAVFDCHGIEAGYIDKIYADIDNDGIKEDCILGYGPTSGLFTVTFSAYENGKLEYFNIFNSEATDIQFGASKDGKVIVRGQVHSDYDYKVYAEYEINIKDGNIVLGSGDSMMAYWGEQGLSSPYAPK